MAKIAIYFWNCLTATSHTTKMAISQSKDFFKWYDSRIIYVVFKGGREEFFFDKSYKKAKALMTVLESDPDLKMLF